MDNNTYFNRRDFINADDNCSDASMSSCIHFYEKDESNHTAELRIRDCRTKVTLHFSLQERGDKAWEDEETMTYDGSLEKVGIMIDHLMAFKVALVNAKKEYDIRLAKEKEEKAKKEEKKDENNKGN